MSKLIDLINFINSQNLNNNDKSLIWKSKKLRFFNFYLLIVYDFDFIIRDNKYIYSREIYFF